MITLFSNNFAIKIYLLADITILGIFMADNFVGYYSAASKVYTSIKEMINAMILVTVPRFSFYLSQNNIETYQKSYSKVFDSVFTLILPCSVGLLFQSGNILYFLGGEEYVNGTGALQILAFAIPFAVMACLFSQSILIPNKQEKYFLRSTIVAAIINIVLNFVFIPFFGIKAAAITTLLSEIIVCTITFFIGRKYIDNIVRIDNDVRSAIIGVTGIALVCVLCTALIKNRLINLIFSVCISCLTYLIITFALENSIVRKTVENILHKK